MGLAAEPLAALSDTQRQQLESLLLGFDQAWHPEALPRWLRRLPSEEERFHLVALLELVKIDLERQWRSGNQRRVEEYLQRFPELGTQETVDPGLLLAEYEARRLIDAPAALRDFQLRFPQRFELLRSLLQECDSSGSIPAADSDPSHSGEASETKKEGAFEFPREFGRYRILKRLGEGGMGSVYLAHDMELDRQVALKVPKFAAGGDKQVVERFDREARTAANLRHANICPVYDVGEFEGTRYISMAYIEGRPLAAYIRRDGRQSERQGAIVVRKVAMALQVAHSRGIVHRDLKPANIMIDRDKQPVIMDFGLARQLDKHEDSRLTQQGSLMGSPAYMSPEQAAGEIDGVGPASDIYSLGVVFFELLTGRVPFEGPLATVLGQIMTQQPPHPSEFREDLDPRLGEICGKMMARRIEDRYESMQAAADALAEYLKAPEGGISRQDTTESVVTDTLRDGRAEAALCATGPPVSPRKAALARLVAAKRLPLRWTWTAGLATAFGLLLLGVLLSLRTPHGTLKIEIDDPNLAISIDGNEYTIGQLETPQRLKAGEHELSVKLGERSIPLGETVKLATGNYNGHYLLSLRLDGAGLTSDHFTITKGDVRVLAIRLDPELLPSRGDPGQRVQTDPPLPTAPTTSGDAERDVAVWVLGNGGTVDILHDARRQQVSHPAGLPDHSFSLAGISLTHNESRIDLAPLRKLAGLETLNLQQTQTGDEDLAHIGSLTSIEVLWLDGTQVTDAGLIHLRDLRRLTHLQLSNTAVGDAGLSHMRELTKLSRLMLNFNPSITDTGLKTLGALTNLVELQIAGATISNAGLEELSRHSQLKVLWLDQTQVSDEGLIHVSRLRNLEYLQLNDTDVGDRGVTQLAQLTELRRLMLRGTRVTDTGVRFLADLPRLTELHLAKTPITDAALEHISKATHLNTLWLDSTAITDNGLAYLTPLRDLTYLQVMDTQITDDGLVAISELPKLERLFLSGTAITDAGATHLLQLKDLRELHLQRTALTETAVKNLRAKLDRCEVKWSP